MRAVWKYELPLDRNILLNMPQHAELVAVHNQRTQVAGDTGWRDENVPTVWALVDTARPMVTRRLYVVGTGHEAPEPFEAKYVGTAVCGAYVWHVFDGGERS